MVMLIIDRRDAELRIQGGRLLVKRPDQARPDSLPLAQIERLVLGSGVSLDTTVLLALARAGVPTTVLGYRDLACVELHGQHHGDGLRRLRQYRFVHDGHACTEAAKALVVGKCLRLYRHVVRQRRAGGKGHTGQRQLDELARLIRRMEGVDSRESLLGLEGAFARLYWGHFATWLPSELAFSGRNRRPPRDPVNALLSLAYTLGHAEAVQALAVAGLDPMLGFYHLPAWSRESLACDMMEILRPGLTWWVLMLCREHVLRADNFSTVKPGGACMLGKAGRGHFYAAWVEQRRQVRRVARVMGRAWVGKLEAYHAGIPA